MNLFRLCPAALTVFLALSSPLSGQGLLEGIDSSIIINGLSTVIDPETGVVTYNGGVSVQYDDMQMRCQSASYNQITGVVHATGGVIIWKAGNFAFKRFVYQWKPIERKKADK